MCAKRILSAVVLSTLMTAPTLSHADQNLSVSIAGGQSFALILPMQEKTKGDLNKMFDETAYMADIKYEAFTYLSVYGKVLHFSGTTTDDYHWDRDHQKWVKNDGPMDLSGTWVGAGITLNTNRDRLISTGLGLGYGYLDKPDDMLNSGHAQFNITFDVTVNVADHWAVKAGWEHLSNGRQIFNRGGQDSEFYPNNGRDYWMVGGTFRF